MRTLSHQPSTKETAQEKSFRARAFEGRSPSISPLSTGQDQPLLQRQCACGGSCPRCKDNLTLQTKLKISEPGDQYEQEADRVADQVMGMLEPIGEGIGEGQSEIPSKYPEHLAHSEKEPQAIDSSVNIQRLASDKDPYPEDAIVIEGEENDSEQKHVQTLRTLGQTSGRESISTGLLNSAQSGVTLASSMRQFMEPRFGADFSRVQIHTDSRAVALSQSIRARAFTHGRHVYFNEGEYQPETHEGKRVLAHELTHVIQQGGSQTHLPIQKHPTQHRDTNVSTTIQRLSKLGKMLVHNVAPWGSGPLGADYEVSTDSGSTLKGWSAYMVFQDQLRYWCHGHSLGTYLKYDYSVYSGTPMATVIKDEWTNIKPDKTKAGDIAVWTVDQNNSQGYSHSALFTQPVIEQDKLSDQKSILSTKNGQSPLAFMTLAKIADIYGSVGIGVFRRK
jgi:Domain of unknown function (DUF4157)